MTVLSRKPGGSGGGGAPSGPAGGDLGGTYPNPTLAAGTGVYDLISDAVFGSTKIYDTNTELGGVIPSTYTHLLLYAQLRADNAAAQLCYLRLNADSGANYYWRSDQDVSSGLGKDQTQMFIGSCNGTGNVANRAGWLKLEIPFYNSTTWDKNVMTEGGRSEDDEDEQHMFSVQGSWNTGNVALTRIQIASATNMTQGFVTGSRFALYGVG